MSREAGKKEEPKWIRRQRRMFTNFCNAKLAERDDVPPVTDIFEDLRDGRLLYALLEELSGQSLASLGRPRATGKGGKPLTDFDRVANLSISFRYVKQTTKIVGIGPSDVADGNESLILGLLWSIIVFFAAKDLGGVDDISSLKKKILKWCQKRTERNDDVVIRNLKDSFMDGRAFLAILNDVDPSFAYKPSATTTDNFRAAFTEAKRYGVPELLDADDDECWKDEQSVVTYLSEMMKRLPESAKNVSGDVLKFVAEHDRDVVRDLTQLCAIPSVPSQRDRRDDCQRAAELLADMMRQDKLAHVTVEDGFVLGSGPWPHDPTLPTVLFVADYGVDAPTDLAEWSGDPFEPLETHDGRLRVAGGAASKCGAVAPVKAVAAMIAALPQKERPAVNVELCVGCFHFPSDFQDGGRIQRFLRETYTTKEESQKKRRPCPTYAIVDTPRCSAGMALERYAICFGCRGQASVKVCVAVGPDDGKKLDKMEYFGPLLDPNQVLAHTLVATRNQKTMAMDVPGVTGLAEKPNRFTRAVQNVDEVHVPPEKTWLAVDDTSLTLAEHVCFEPGIAITEVNPGFRRATERPAYPEKVSRATIFCTLAPAFPHDLAHKALKRKLDASVVWGAQITVDPDVGNTGFLTEPSSFIGAFQDAASSNFSGHRQPAAVVCSPSFLPLAACVARALPTTNTLACGVSDQDAGINCPDEALLLDDFRATVNTFVHLLTTLKVDKPRGGLVDPATVFAFTENLDEPLPPKFVPPPPDAPHTNGLCPPPPPPNQEKKTGQGGVEESKSSS